MGWKDEALCFGTDTDMFIDEDEAALRMCRSCPVQPQCLEYAIETDAKGVWGGTTEAQREVYRLKDSLLDGEIEIRWEELR